MNTLGQPYVAGVQHAQQFALVDVREVRENRWRFRRDMLPVLERANSFYCPAGRWPSRGWVLLTRGDYTQLNPYSTALQLTIGDATAVDNVGVLGNLAVVQAQCVTRGIASDPNAVYLVELTDARGLLHNKWFQFPTTSAYNIRSPAYPETFQLESMADYPTAGPVSKTTWTWSTMIGDLWTQMGDFLGPYPGLPYAPAGTPEGFWFVGVSAWHALCDILGHLGLIVTANLTSANPFSIVNDGANDSALTALQAKYATNLLDDLEWLDVGAGRVPKFVKVLFRRRNTVYGTEETTPYRNDSMAQQWDMKPFYSVTTDAPALFASAAGTHHIWSDFTVRYDQNSLPLAADVVTAEAIAAERTSQYFDRIYSRASGFMSQTYSGALPFTTGSQVDGVCWRHDYESQGWQTQIVRGPAPPWGGLWD